MDLEVRCDAKSFSEHRFLLHDVTRYLSRGSRRAATPKEEFGDALRLIGGDAGDHIGETLLRVEKPLSLALAISEYEQKMKFACASNAPYGLAPADHVVQIRQGFEEWPLGQHSGRSLAAAVGGGHVAAREV